MSTTDLLSAIRYPLFLAGSLIVSSAGPVSAMFEDTPPCSASLGLGGSGAALEAPGCAGLNPALTGSYRKFAVNTDFLSSFRVPQGAAEFNTYAVGAAFPIMSYGRLGTMGFGGSYRDDGGVVTEKTMAFSAGTWQFLKTNPGMLDFGVTFKIMQAASVAGEDSQAGASMDFGALLRPGEGRTIGVSVLNLNRPSFALGALKEKAPLSVRLGAAEKRDDYTIVFEAAQRTASGALPGNTSFASGIEHLWRTYRYGVFASRIGLFLARRSSSVSLGLGFKRQASEFSYSLSVPLTGLIKAAHALTLSLRFGDRDIEPEYERIMRQEIKYRKDLVIALDESAKRENILKGQLAELKAEIDGLSAELRASEEKKAEVKASRDKLEAVVERQRKAEAELRVLEEKRKTEKLDSLRFEFSGEWQSYLKLKSGGAPAGALKGALQRLIAQYQNSGIDISQATLELRDLMAK